MRKTILTVVFLVPLTWSGGAAFAQTRNGETRSITTAAKSIVSCVPGSKASANPKEAKREAERFYRTGVKYGVAKSFEQAAASFLLATCLQPDFANAYHGLGHAYFDLRRWQESIKALERAVELNPKDMEAYAMMGHAYFNLRRETNGGGQVSGYAVAQKISNEVSPVSSTRSSVPESNERALTTIYRVGAGDVLEVRLHSAAADKQTLYTVSAAGLLDHPSLSEPLKVSGLTTEEIGKRIESDLNGRGISDKSQVSVGVREYNSHTIIVSGLLKEPGTKALRREAIPLYVVMADAQPLPEAARAIVKSHQKGESIVVDIMDTRALELLVRPGDVITVERSLQQFFYVGGNVKVPGEKVFRPGLTLTQAILSAGGVNKNGSEAEVAREDSQALLMIKRYNLKDIYRSKSADPEILPGDRINVIQ